MILLPSTNLVVDDFHTEKFRGLDIVHVLTHFHSDHRQGLTPSFRGQIACSEITGRFLELLGVKKQFIDVHQVNVPFLIEPDETVGLPSYKVVFIDANHCPGSVSLIVEGKGFSYFYMGDSRISKEIINVAKYFHAAHYDIGWIDSTFVPESRDWDSMPTHVESIIALKDFIRNSNICCAFEFEMLGTEILLGPIMEAYPREKILIERESRLSELEIVYEREPSKSERLVLLQKGMLESGLYRFVIISRATPTPSGMVRIRATSQRWASRIKEAGPQRECPILEYDEDQRICYVFFSIHSCTKEVEDFIGKMDIRRVEKLVRPVEIQGSTEQVVREPPTPNREKTRRERCPRRDFEYSCDSIWLESLYESQETVRATFGSSDLVLPTWGAREF